MNCTCRKLIFVSRLAAERHAAQAGGPKLYPYRCPGAVPPVWHLSHRRKKPKSRDT